MNATQNRLVGRIATVPNGNGFGFIAIDSVTTKDGQRHGLPTTTDIFIHQDESRVKLQVGKRVEFDVTLDHNRGPGHFRATAATNGFELVAPGTFPAFTLVVPPVRSREELSFPRRLPIHSEMKDVPAEVVAKVVENMPLARVPRPQTPDGRAPEVENKDVQLQKLLAYLFPAVSQFGTDFSVVDAADDFLDKQVAEAIMNYQTLGITEQIPILKDEVARFKSMRAVLKLLHDENLARPDTVIPMPYLADLFMAAPVWYVIPREASDKLQMEQAYRSNREYSSSIIRHFCGLFPNDNWMTTFQLFNWRARPMHLYRGESIPPAVVRVMTKAVQVFDYVVVMTPYHDQALTDWKSSNWKRPIDPYVVGFKKGIPFFFVLGRYSGTGTFPLLNELIADTIGFLKEHVGELRDLTNGNGIYMTMPRFMNGQGWESSPGKHFTQTVIALLSSFEAGNLFDWLRGTDTAVTAQK